MSTMRERTVLLPALLCAGCITFAGCGKGPPAPPPPAPTTTALQQQEPVTQPTETTTTTQRPSTYHDALPPS